jgi:hypothetical protein
MIDISLLFTQLFVHYFLQTLISLDLNGNQIYDQGAEHFAKALRQNKVIQ